MVMKKSRSNIPINCLQLFYFNLNRKHKKTRFDFKMKTQLILFGQLTREKRDVSVLIYLLISLS